jgi:hypothetical protein
MTHDEGSDRIEYARYASAAAGNVFGAASAIRRLPQGQYFKLVHRFHETNHVAIMDEFNRPSRRSRWSWLGGAA